MHYAVSDFLLDIVQNSIEAGSSSVMVEYIEENGRLEVYISDNGKGMDAETLAKVKDPFYTDGCKHEGRKVGLGIPFLIQSAEAAGGSFEIKSEPGYGTSVYFSFDLTNIDCPPQGNLPATFLSMMLFPGGYEVSVRRKKGGMEYSLSRLELIETLGGLEEAESLALAKRYMVSLEEE
ncbi:MAG: hypothetical protein A2X76_12035 [Lysobacterales bacterium GWF1_69_6]|nr:MAG: hypothetical protein A2X76_12035 [Xanthomonadales bacterium GWF1_69_6]